MFDRLSKKFERNNQQCINHCIQVNFVSLGVTAIDKKTTFYVTWKRGDAKQACKPVTLEPLHLEQYMGDSFAKESQFWLNPKTSMWEKKTCNFMIADKPDGKPFFELEENMALYVGQSQQTQRIDLDCKKHPGLHMEIMWTVIPSQVYNTTDKKEYDKGIIKVDEGKQVISAMQNPNLDHDKLGDLSIEEAHFMDIKMQTVNINTEICGLQPKLMAQE